jgi:D-beta-D-heptose 7-phosphate kinase / D-beta-D-heptose 1-phosphate adenosyltransferase
MSKTPTDSISTSRLKRLVPRFRGIRMGVVGDVMLDRYLWGTASRLSPEAAVPVVDFVEQNDRPGGAGNVAANLAALGARVELFSVIGSEEGQHRREDAGVALRKRLEEEGIGHKGVLDDPNRITTVKTRIIARHQHIVRVDRERREPLDADMEGRLLRALSGALKRLDVLVISDYDKGVMSENFAEHVFELTRNARIATFVAPKRSRLYAHRGASAIVCNVDEAKFFLNSPLMDEKSVEEAGQKLLPHFGAAAVLITRSEKGMSLFDENSPRPLHIPATGVEVTYARVGQTGVERGSTGRQVFDVTGAGDTVLSVLALASAADAKLPDAARLANVAAGIVVSKLGTATVTPQELLHALGEMDRS